MMALTYAPSFHRPPTESQPLNQWWTKEAREFYEIIENSRLSASRSG